MVYFSCILEGSFVVTERDSCCCDGVSRPDEMLFFQNFFAVVLGVCQLLCWSVCSWHLRHYSTQYLLLLLWKRVCCIRLILLCVIDGIFLLSERVYCIRGDTLAQQLAQQQETLQHTAAGDNLTNSSRRQSNTQQLETF